MTKITPLIQKEDEEEDKIHSISISNFTKKNEGEYDPELLDFCRCICCCCLLFTDCPERWLSSCLSSRSSSRLSS